MSNAEERAEMPKGKNWVLDRRTVVNGNANLLKILKRGDSVLDVGCGTGAITKDIAKLVGAQGLVVGIDSSTHLITQAKETFGDIENLSFQVADINTFPVNQQFDVVTSARVLQWVAGPFGVLKKMKAHVKPGGSLTVLDYNHEKIEFNPAIPDSMQLLYNSFLKWRSDAAMDNQIADNMADMFTTLGLQNVTVEDYSEASILGKASFHEDLSIWIKVAEARGPQLVADGYLDELERQKAINDYSHWIKSEAKYMMLYLKAVTGLN